MIYIFDLDEFIALDLQGQIFYALGFGAVLLEWMFLVAFFYHGLKFLYKAVPCILKCIDKKRQGSKKKKGRSSLVFIFNSHLSN